MPDRPLIVDADIDHRLATELRSRGRNAFSAAELGVRTEKDPVVLAAVAQRHPDGVLVTGDDSMPASHTAALREASTTLATVDSNRPDAWANDDHWRRETIHRWIHRIEEQPPGTIWRYGLSARRWTRRRRRLRLP